MDARVGDTWSAEERTVDGFGATAVFAAGEWNHRNCGIRGEACGACWELFCVLGGFCAMSEGINTFVDMIDDGVGGHGLEVVSWARAGCSRTRIGHALHRLPFRPVRWRDQRNGDLGFGRGRAINILIDRLYV